MSDADADLSARTTALSRTALERVLARAAQLQGTESDHDEPGLSDEELVEIARDVGLAPVHLRQALAEERSRLEAPPSRGAVDRLFGPAVARAMRTWRGTPAEHLAALDAWMQQQEGLRVKRRFPDRTLWERAPGLVANLSRAFDVAGRGYHLARADEVSAIVVAVDAERTLVRVEASLAHVRAGRMTGGGALAALGAAGTGTALLIGIVPLIAIAPAVVFATAGWFTARSHVASVERAQLALEQVLDRLERPEPPRPSLLSSLVAPTRPR